MVLHEDAAANLISKAKVKFMETILAVRRTVSNAPDKILEIQGS